MKNYYYLISSLQEMTLGDPLPRLSFQNFCQFAEEELEPDHYSQLKTCFLLNDIANLASITRNLDLSGERHIPEIPDTTLNTLKTPSRFSPSELSQSLKDPDMLPPFMAEFIIHQKSGEQDSKQKNSLKTKAPRYSPENELLQRLSEFMTQDSPFLSSFTQNYLRFEIHLRNFAAALSYRKENRSYSEATRPFDYFTEQLTRSRAMDFGLGGELGVMAPLLETYENASAIDCESAIVKARWHWLDEWVDYNVFSAPAVFSYGIKIADTERWNALYTRESPLDALLAHLEESTEGELVK